MAAIPYNPQIHTESNKSYGMGQPGPTDARSCFFDTTFLTYRPYKNAQEVYDYLGDQSLREGQFSIYIGDPANNVPVTEWWFKDGTDNINLVAKGAGAASGTTAGAVMIASEADMELTAATADDNPPKVPSRQRIYAWWKWIRDNLQDITSAVSWKFTFLAGGGERIVSALPDGAIQANIEMAEEITDNATIIGACKTASDQGKFTAANGYTTSILPAGGLTFYKGQKCKKDGEPYMYIAFNNNVVTRIPLG